MNQNPGFDLARRMAQQLLRHTPFTEMQKHSVLNYHAKGFDYLCLHRSPELTVKVYLFGDGIQNAGPEGSDYLIYPHDHAYDFDTYVIGGRVDNVRFQKLGPASEVRGLNGWEEYRYKPEARAFTCTDNPLHLIGDRTRYHYGEHYYHDSREIHTISVRSGTSLLLFQYADLRTETLLFAKSKTFRPETQDMYVRPSLAEVEKLADRACDALDISIPDILRKNGERISISVRS